MRLSRACAWATGALLVASMATACTGGGDDDSDATPTPSSSIPTSTGATITLTRPSKPLKTTIVQIRGGVKKRDQERVRRAIAKPIAAWVDGGFVTPTYPQSDFADAFASWTQKAGSLARRDDDVTTNATLGPDLLATVADRQTARLFVFASHGRTGGATARVQLRFTAQKADTSLVHFVVEGELYLTRHANTWQIFGYRLSREAVAWTVLGLRAPTTFRAWRRLATFGALLALLGLTVPDASRPEAQFALIKLDQVQGLDASDHVVWVLALGSDARPGEPVLGSRSDAIQLVGINTVTHHGVTIGVPRDSWVDIQGHMDKINAGMVYGGAQGMATAVSNLIGITPDYVFVTSFPGLIHMVGGINGIRAKVTYEMDDQGQVFHPGMHKFTGVEALAFARIRHGIPGGDFDRSMDQGQLLKGGLATIKAKLDRPGFFERAIGLLAKYTDTNVNPIDMYRLGRDVLEVNATKVQTCVLTGGLGFVGEQSVVFPDVSAARALGEDVRHDATVDHGCSR